MSDDDRKSRPDQEVAAQERNAEPMLRDILKAEYNEMLKGRRRNPALDRWEAEIEAQIKHELE